MKKWNLIIDVAECHNCNNCVIACKDEYIGNSIPGYAAPQPLHDHKWIEIKTNERGRYPTPNVTYLPTMCNHCDNAPCVKKGGGAVIKRDDGIVIIDPEKAQDRKDIVESCPYRAIWWNKELGLPQAWIFDAHLLDRGWKHPRCVQSCPTQAIRAVKITDNEMATIIAEENLEPIRPELNTKPRVHYKNLHLFNKLFVAGEVLMDLDGELDCAASTTVQLNSQGQILASTETCTFGDFTIDGLAPNTGNCTLTFSHNEFRPKTIPITIDSKSVVLDTVVLNRLQ